MEEEEARAAGCEEGGNVGRGWWVGVDMFKVPISHVRLDCMRSLWRSEAGGNLYCSGATYIPPFVHCASSTISKLECVMNWFM